MTSYLGVRLTRVRFVRLCQGGVSTGRIFEPMEVNRQVLRSLFSVSWHDVTSHQCEHLDPGSTRRVLKVC